MTFVSRDGGPNHRPGRSGTDARGGPRDRAALGWRLLVLVALVVAAVGAWQLAAQYGVSWSDVRAATSSPEAFRAWIDGFGAWAPVMFVLAEALQVIVAPIPGTVFPPIGAAAFGPELGLVLSLTGMALGSAVVFLLVRRWGRPLVLRLVDRETFDRYIRIVGNRGGLWLFLILLFPVLPGDAVCALGGLSPISFRRFLVVTTLGRLPGTVLSVYVVADLLDRPAWLWLLVGALLLAGLGIALRYRARLETWLVGPPRQRADRAPTRLERTRPAQT